MKANRTIALLLAVLALVASACGGGDDGTDEGEPATTSSAETDSTSEEATASVEAGQELYVASCQSCHGADGTIGPELPGADGGFVASTSPEELAAFIKAGRLSSDPDNTTGLDMPVKGGNPALGDDDINNIVAYLKSIS
ncbi:MAG: cytochrome c [Actinomycetia bacterium]|nr:cytochrome c [Actinomycetes bacterium]MCP4960426.1 cytochrome c [Actinomycetes bacterium]